MSSGVFLDDFLNDLDENKFFRLKNYLFKLIFTFQQLNKLVNVYDLYGDPQLFIIDEKKFIENLHCLFDRKEIKSFILWDFLQSKFF